MILLTLFLRRLISIGSLTVVDAAGCSHRFTRGSPGPDITIRLHDRWLPYRLFFNPSLACGEAYMDGSLTIEGATLYDFYDLLGQNMRAAGLSEARDRIKRIGLILRRFQQFNPVSRARQNVHHHYDLSRELYALFLDKDQQYSCAYFAHPEDTLEQAQEQKKRHILSKLLVEPGQTVLDIGSGWGGLGLFLAKESGAQVTGVTLSDEQLALARQRAGEEGLHDRVEFALRDYREQEGRFDRIVSVGMFEHVGINHYDAFFAKVRTLLEETGIGVLHCIGRTDGPGVTDPWIRKYIFPGGYSPALSEVSSAIERAGLYITDVEVLRLHYAETLHHWRRRFLANRHKAAALYDERFCRMWEYYLVISEIAFRYLNTVVFQIQMAKRLDAVPITRDYVTEGDRARPTMPGYERTRRSA
jgi:cyclopropane-fatty-acyl-phospholipid synthase